MKKSVQILGLAGIVGLLGGGAGVLTLRNLKEDLPETVSLPEPVAGTVVFDQLNHALFHYKPPHYQWVPYEKIPESVRIAFLQVEDQDFFDHPGVSLKGLLRALWVNLRSARIVQGGSTITQQLARRQYLSRERTLERKLKEMIIALAMEEAFAKEEILEAYLNTVFLGNRSYGIHAAAWNYFGKKLEDLKWAEVAMLAGLPKAPSRFAPHRHFERAKARQRVVLEQLVEGGVLSDEEARQEAERPIALKKPSQSRYHGYFRQLVEQELRRRLGAESLHKGRYQIDSFYDPELERFLSQQLKKLLQGDLQFAYSALDPRTGALKAISGGRDFNESQFNRALHLNRPVGGSLFPFLLAFGFQKGLGYEDPWMGQKDLATILDHSSEALFHGLSKKFASKDFRDFLRAFELPALLGQSLHASPLILARAMAGFWHPLGQLCPVRFLKGVRMKDRPIWQAGLRCKPLPSLSGESAYLTTHALRWSQKRALTTLSDLKDPHNAWMGFYSSKLSLVIWLGAERGLTEIREPTPLKEFVEQTEEQLNKMGYGAPLGSPPPNISKTTFKSGTQSRVLPFVTKKLRQGG